MTEGKKVSAMLPKSWRKSFNIGVVIPAKMRFCNECSKKIVVIGVLIKFAKIKNLKLI